MRSRHWLVLTVFLAGCAQLPFLGSAKEAGNPDSFEMLGRVYVRFGERAFSGSLRWRHALESDEAWLGGPLGQTGAHILRDSSGATLTTADQQIYRSNSIEALTREGLGWSLPLADLSYYVLNRVPAELTASAQRDASGRIAALDRDGWSVRWIPRESTGAAGSQRLELTKADVQIRLVVDRLDPQAH